jgi:hypothetical protein
MSALIRFSTPVTSIVAAVTLFASSLPAQQHANPSPAWPSRLSLSILTGQFNPAGNSEAFRLFDAALSHGTDDLTPRVTGGALRVRLWRRLSIIGSTEAGHRRVDSYSMVTPAGVVGPVAQQTQLDLRGVHSLGVQWQAWRWSSATRTLDRARVQVGAGAGRVSYSLRQWGHFVDASRLVVFGDDLASSGRGTFAYASAAVEVPVTRWAAALVDVRRQSGSARMNGDFAAFDALDLSGTRLSAGVSLSPWR